MAGSPPAARIFLTSASKTTAGNSPRGGSQSNSLIRIGRLSVRDGSDRDDELFVGLLHAHHYNARAMLRSLDQAEICFALPEVRIVGNGGPLQFNATIPLRFI